MPDAFGQETPQEAVARVRGAFSQRNQDFWNSNAASSKGAQAGQALANIFGGTVRTAIDTHSMRKSEAQRLAEEQGLSTEDAKALAKQNIPFQSREVRQAAQMQKSATEARDLMEQLTPQVGPELARASAMLFQANKLRSMGFTTEASKMSIQAIEIRRAEEQRLAEMENLKARTRASNASAGASEENTRRAGQTTFQKNVERREELMALIDTSNDPAEIAGYERELGNMEAKIAKDTAITGTTEHDPSALNRAAATKQQNEIIDLDVMNEKMNAVVAMLRAAEGDPAATFLGQFGAWGLGFAEQVLNRQPSESEADFQKRANDFKALPSIVAAQIRNQLTGAAMSAQEIPFLEPFLPAYGDPRSVMLNKTLAFQKFLNLDMKVRRAALDGGEKTTKNLFKLVQAEAAAEIAATKKPDTAKPTTPEKESDDERFFRLTGMHLNEGQ